jgi:predicted neuraminidase
MVKKINSALIKVALLIAVTAQGTSLGTTARATGAAQIEKPFYQAQLIFKPNQKFPRCHSSSISGLPDGSLLAVWWNGSQEGGKDLVIRFSRRPPGEGVWTPPIIVGDSPGLTEGNPVFVHPPGREVWLLYRSGLPWVKLMRTTSSNMGVTWSEPEIFLNEPGWSLRNRSINLTNGDIIIPIMRREVSAFLCSSDGGANWEKSEPITSEPRNNEPGLFQRSDGSLLTFMRHYNRELDRRFLWRSESFDRGRTWSQATPTTIPNPSSAIELLKLKNGHVLLAFNDSREKRTPLCLALSLDDGQSWSSKRVLEDAPGRFSYPSMFQSGDGRIHLSYTFRRKSVKHVEVNEAWVRAGSPWNN